nr:MAG TPA: baseplate protein [Caudoviricetes sp.]
MRLIDGDALWEKLDDEPWFDNADRDEVALPIVSAAPTVDAEVVVRCKDCYQSVVIGNVLYCTYWRKNTDENGYCHEGG